MDEINSCIDIPDKRDYPADEYLEMAQGEDFKKRPEEEVIIWNQGKEGACTRFGLGHVSNGENINEYNKNGQKYEQKNPKDIWDISTKELTLVSALIQFKSLGLIEGWLALPKVPTDKNKVIQQMKQAIDMGRYIFTGSDNGDWVKTKKSGIYTLRTDGRIVGHAWSIVGYDDNKRMFKCINSYGPTRGDKGYFWLSYDLIDKIFTKYIIIDKDDTGKFKTVKEKEIMKQVIEMLGKGYNNTKYDDLKQIFHNCANEVRKKYGLS